MVIEQFVPFLHAGDAVGNSTLRFHHYLKSKGLESRIVALACDPELSAEAVLFPQYREPARAVQLFHYATPSELNTVCQRSTQPRILVYHNVTPHHYFCDYSPELARLTFQARQELKNLAVHFDLAIADSNFNAAELKHLGFCDIRVFPILIDPAGLSDFYSPTYYQYLNDGRHNIIFVGRVTPNKKIEDLIKMFFFLKKYLLPASRLVICGSATAVPRYFAAVRDLAARFYLNQEDIVFTGHVPAEELRAVYRSASVFVSASEHEGFCVPLIESCFFKVPLIAFDAGAVAETMGRGGVLVRDKQCDTLAGLVEMICRDDQLRERLNRAQEKRLQDYARESDPARLLDLIRPLWRKQ